MDIIAPIQQLVIGSILIWSGVWKVLIPNSVETAHRSALSVYINKKTILEILFRSLGIIELLIGLSLVLPPHFRWENVAASVLALGFVVYLVISFKVAPDKPCGCMGNRGKPISWRTLVRAGYFLLLTLIGWLFTSRFWYTSLSDHYWLAFMALLEVGIFMTLSSELDWIWVQILKIPLLRTLAFTLIGQVDCTSKKVSLLEIISRLNNSQVFLIYKKIIKSDLIEHWRNGCWYFLSYSVMYQGHQAVIVFSVPIKDRPNWVRAAIFNEKEDLVLLQVDPMDIELLKYSPQMLNS